MPRTDSLDPRALHNLSGIDLRKNSDQNAALDAVNVRVNSGQLFVNRLMPSLYKGKAEKYIFACESRDLSGLDFDFDISSYNSSPSISSLDKTVPDRYQKDFSSRLSGSGLSLVSNLFISSPSSFLVGNSDFSFTFYKDKSSDVESLLLSIDPDPGSQIIVISPFGSFTYTVPYSS